MEIENVRLLPQSQIVSEWWLEVKEKFWEENVRTKVKALIKLLMEQTMKEEVNAFLKRVSYERKATTYRNGHYKRSLITQFGLLDGIKVPRLRNKAFVTKVFKRYKRCQAIVEDLVEGIFLAGVSTRRVGEAVSMILETSLSASSVSRITKRLDALVKRFHVEPLLDEYQYLFLDGIDLKVKYLLKYHHKKVLVAYGITVFGQRRLLAFLPSKGESTEAWESLLNRLYQRGLKGQTLKLIVMDGAKGCESAVQLVYPLTPVQLCWAHKLRNVANNCPKKYEAECLSEVKGIYQAQNKVEALEQYKAWKDKWQSLCPNAVRCLDRDFYRLLRFFMCPKEHWKRVRTTNVIERSFREVRRRTKVFSCFSNEESLQRIIYAIFTHLNKGWGVRPLRKFTQFN